VARSRPTAVAIVLADAGRLTQFGVICCHCRRRVVQPRHWHVGGNEFVYVLSGEAVLITDRAEEVLARLRCAAFPGLCRTPSPGHRIGGRWLCLGCRIPDRYDFAFYPDVDRAVVIRKLTGIRTGLNALS